MKNITVIFIILITVIFLSVLTVVLFQKNLPFVIEFEKSESCGDGICGPGETTYFCPNDCHCDDATFDEVIGEWSQCSGNKQRRFVQNSCGDTTIEIRNCVSQPSTTTGREFVITSTKFLDQIAEINREVIASKTAFDEGIITETTLRSRLDSASKDSLSIYYDMNELSAPGEYTQLYELMSRAVAQQLTGVDEMLKYFDDSSLSHLDSGVTWIEKSQDYERDARALIA